MNLLAEGHDSGMIEFNEGERPVFSVVGDCLYYIKGRFLRSYKFSNQKGSMVVPIRWARSVSLNQRPRTLSFSPFSPTENAVLICSDADGGTYELYSVPKDHDGWADVVRDAKKGGGGSAVFVAHNRFAVLDKSTNQALVKNLRNEIVKEIPLPIDTDAIFYAGTGNLLCRAGDEVVIFDLQQRLILGELQVPAVKYIIWSSDMKSIALLSNNVIVIANKALVHCCTLREILYVKSGVWDDNGAFIYTNLLHLKYCLPNGENGILKNINVEIYLTKLPIYLTKVSGNTVFFLDRDVKKGVMTIDATEYIFKLALLRKNYEHVMNMINNSQVCGQPVITYLLKKGFPELALHLVKDERTRFNLALESGNIQIAVASAKEIDEKDHWYRLGIEALRQGNTSIAEYAYQRTKNFMRLSFLYLVTGNKEKLSKMLRIPEMKNDVMSQFHNAMYLGDIEERVKILENAGYLHLAYVTASTHGLIETAERLGAELGDDIPAIPKVNRSLLLPPAPLLNGGDWPLLRVMRGISEGGLDISSRPGYDDVEANEENGGRDLEDLELPPEAVTPVAAGNTRASVFVAPTQGMPVSQFWTQKSITGLRRRLQRCTPAEL